eukprot:11304261-Prorocentrum_lima.AAC.1
MAMQRGSFLARSLKRKLLTLGHDAKDVDICKRSLSVYVSRGLYAFVKDDKLLKGRDWPSDLSWTE